MNVDRLINGKGCGLSYIHKCEGGIHPALLLGCACVFPFCLYSTDSSFLINQRQLFVACMLSEGEHIKSYRKQF